MSAGCRWQEEKRYYQLELVNRETNFNKVFSADPKVGVLNPLTVNKVHVSLFTTNFFCTVFRALQLSHSLAYATVIPSVRLSVWYCD